MVITYTIFRTNLGRVFVAATDRGVCGLHFLSREADEGEKEALRGLTQLFPGCRFVKKRLPLTGIIGEVHDFLEGRLRRFRAPVDLRGTPFQLRVWRELQWIPYGQTRTYGDVAACAGNPRAARAVGMACNRNPVSLIIPCHRVVGSGGRLVGYAGGIGVKRKLLELEAR